MSKPPIFDELVQHTVSPLEHLFEVNRRDLFKLMGAGIKLMGAGIVVGFCRPAFTQESGRSQPESTPQNLDAWIHIGGNGKITVFTGKVEVGQNIRTSLAQQVAEELRVPVSSVTMVMGDTDLTPFDLGTFGSRSTPQMGTRLRNVAATARELLLEMAAQNWKAERSQLVAQNGAISNPKSGQSISYAALTHGQKLVRMLSENPAVTPPSQWHIAGTAAPKVDGRAFVTGIHQYTSDMGRPGMLHGKVLRPSALNATLTSVEMNGADKLPGVRVVRDGDFVGVAAGNPFAAEQALELLKAQWKAPQQLAEKDLFEYLRKNADTEARGGFGGRASRDSGSVENAMAAAAKTLSQTYTVAYIQHAPLEPRAAVAEWENEKLTVWTGTQRPFAVKQELASVFHISEDKVRVMVPDTGSAYGGKHTSECAVEAARLAKSAGKPVKLVWTREEEFTWAYFRPAGVIDVRSATAADGTLLAWEFHNYNSGPAGIETPYAVANKRIEFHPTKNPPLRQGSYRGLAATANHFARESHMDELAHLAGMDPLQFRLKNLSDPRLRAVFETAAEKFGWGKQPPTGERGFGMAGGFEKGGYVAACVEVAMDRANGRPGIVRIVEAFDCGAVINPSGLQNQISGAIVQGIGGALFEAMHFENGAITNPHFHDYPVPRFHDLPRIQVEIIDRKDQRSMGAGETPIIALAPAVANGIFSASGKRLRSMPLMQGTTQG